MKLVAIGNCMGAPDYFKGLGLDIHILRHAQAIHDAENQIDENTVILYGGGEDISPGLYNQVANPRTLAPSSPSNRDKLEQYFFNLGKKRGAAHYGICRGAQLLAALSGGTLFQHVDRHNSPHTCILSPDVITHKHDLYQYLQKENLFPFVEEKIKVTSVHHQAVNIKDLKKARPDTISVLETPCLSHNYHTDESFLTAAEVKEDNEAFLIPSLRVFGVQGHPEFDPNINSPFVRFCRSMMSYLMEEKHAN